MLPIDLGLHMRGCPRHAKGKESSVGKQLCAILLLSLGALCTAVSSGSLIITSSKIENHHVLIDAVVPGKPDKDGVTRHGTLFGFDCVQGAENCHVPTAGQSYSYGPWTGRKQYDCDDYGLYGEGQTIEACLDSSSVY